MEPFLWLMGVAVIGAFIWLFKKLSTLKETTLDEVEFKQIKRTREEVHKKEKTTGSGQEPPEKTKKPSEIKQDPNSGIHYE